MSTQQIQRERPAPGRSQAGRHPLGGSARYSATRG